MFKDIRDNLYTILQGLTGSGKPFAECFPYFEVAFENYPAVMVRATGGSSEIRLDSASNLVSAEFTVRILLKAENNEEAENSRLDLIDAVLDEFRKQVNVDTLGGEVEKFDILNINMIEAEEGSPRIGADLVVSGSKIQYIT